MITSSLNRNITFEVKDSSKNSLGTPIDTWTLAYTTYASMYIRGGNTNFNEYSSTPNTTVEWTIRYTPIVNYNCRIVSNGNYYKILFIEELGRREGLKITSIRFIDEQ